MENGLGQGNVVDPRNETRMGHVESGAESGVERGLGQGNVVVPRDEIRMNNKNNNSLGMSR